MVAAEGVKPASDQGGAGRIGLLLLFALLVEPLTVALGLFAHTDPEGQSSVINLIASAGAGGWLVVATHFLGLLTLIVLGILAVLGRRVPSAALLLPALFPIAIGMLGARAGLRMTQEAIAHVSADDATMIAANGLGETLGNPELGLLMGGGLLGLVAVIVVLAPSGLGRLKFRLGFVGLAVAVVARILYAVWTISSGLGTSISSSSVAEASIWLPLLGCAGLLLGLGSPSINSGPEARWVSMGAFALLLCACCALVVGPLGELSKGSQCLCARQSGRQGDHLVRHRRVAHHLARRLVGGDRHWTRRGVAVRLVVASGLGEIVRAAGAVVCVRRARRAGDARGGHAVHEQAE